ncbi:DUF1007 family protein [Lichenibacterium dinghuense]|uniref:DUF1007 family protein n=1 Tax=Lichenibacterium dinghuense TaxID=2895977 RepID=UPI001F48EE2A|nr:DUF1007 family protein [Lichenibacterium sp. 6Y81]
MHRPSPSRRGRRPASVGLLAALACTLAAGGAAAHPHVFVTAKEQVLFGPDGKVTGVRADWTFDDMYSSFVTQGLGTPGQLLTREELAPLAKTNVENLAEWGYFTRVKLGSQTLAFGEPVDYWIDESPDKLVTLHYTLPLKVPVSAVPAVNVQVYDPTYFVDFKMAERDPVALVSAPAGCSFSVIKPRPLDASDNQKLTEAFFANMSPGTDFGIKLASKVMVACP